MYFFAKFQVDNPKHVEDIKVTKYDYNDKQNSPLNLYTGKDQPHGRPYYKKNEVYVSTSNVINLSFPENTYGYGKTLICDCGLPEWKRSLSPLVSYVPSSMAHGSLDHKECFLSTYLTGPDCINKEFMNILWGHSPESLILTLAAVELEIQRFEASRKKRSNSRIYQPLFNIRNVKDLKGHPDAMRLMNQMLRISR